MQRGQLRMNDSVRHMAIICGNHVRRVLVDPGTAIWLLALPLALMGILGIGLQGLMSPDFTPDNPYRVVVGETASGAHHALLGPLQGMPEYVEVIATASPGVAREMVAQREADAAIMLSERHTAGDAAASTVTLISAPGALATEVLTSILDNVLLQMQAGRTESVRAVHTEVQVEAGGTNGLPAWLQTDAFTYYAIAVTAMFVMFAANAVSSTAARDRATDAYARLRALGVKPVVCMVGGSMASIVVSFLFLSVMAVVSSLLFGVAWGNMLSWVALTLMGATAAAGLSLVLLALIPKPEHIDGAGAALFNVLAFLGGSMTPLQVLPEWFRTSLGWLPNRAVLTGYLKAAEGAGLAAISGELMTLGVATVVLFTLGWAAWTMRAKEEA